MSQVKRQHAAHDFELNLTPIIDCFVTLICFLLLSATYVNLVGMDAKVPIAVPSSSVKTDNEQKFKLELIAKSNGVEIVASNAGSASGKRWIPHIAALPDFASIHRELVKVKTERPKELSINFNTETDMPYEQLVRFMDTTRNLLKTDPNFQVTDERNGKVLKMDVLFPDFVMSGLAAESKVESKR